jgi:uncharacterized protein (TIGR02147 family)
MADLTSNSISIFSYLDYHRFLRDRYEELRRKNPDYTYRFIAGFVGLKSPGHITSIFNGNRNIPLRSAARFARTFGLLKKEAAYLELLIHYDASKTHYDKKYYFEQIADSQQRHHTVIDPRKYEFYDKWYYSVIREIVEIHEIRDSDGRELAHLLVPAITPAEARKALELLLSLDLIYTDDTGRYRRRDTVLVAPESWSSLAIRSFQMDMAEKGKEALEHVPRDQRDISTITMSISREKFEIIKQRIDELRQQAFAMAATDEKPEQVFELNIQLFPLSKAKAPSSPGEMHA